MNKFKALKEKAYDCNMELVKQGVVISTFGNASCFDPKNKVFAIKPSGVPYDYLTPDMMVIVDLDNTIIEGEMNPSSDTKTHVVLYNHFTGITGIVHTHSTYAVAWAQANMPIPILGTTHADHLPQDIPCTQVMSDDAITRDYEVETGLLIVECFKSISYKDIQMVLVGSHGPFTWGEKPEDAVYNSVMLEELAKMAFITKQINPHCKEIKNTLIQKHFQRKHGENSYYGQEKGQLNIKKEKR